MKKIVAILGIIILLFGLVALLVPNNQDVIAADKDKGECYLVCALWCPPLVCGAANVCWWWVEQCPDNHTPAKR